jgi:hypothetical protein
MRKLLVAGALGALVLGGCVSTPDMSGSMGAPSLSALQSMCGTAAVDYGVDGQSVYSALYDAYVAQKRGGLSKDQFCAFQAGIAGPRPKRKARGRRFSPISGRRRSAGAQPSIRRYALADMQERAGGA